MAFFIEISSFVLMAFITTVEPSEMARGANINKKGNDQAWRHACYNVKNIRRHEDCAHILVQCVEHKCNMSIINQLNMCIH